MPSFNDIEKQRIKKIVGGFCQERIPDHQRCQVKLLYEIKGYDVQIIECRPCFSGSHLWTETPIARLQYDPDTLGWELYWRKASGKWQKYPELKPTIRLQLLIEEIKCDPHRIFWG